MNRPLKLSRLPLLGVVLGFALAFAGCATTPGGVNPVTGGPAALDADSVADTAPQAAAAEPDVAIETINVVGEGDKVLIETKGSVKYTVFRLSEPPRLIVDMPGVSLDNVSEPIAVDNDFIGVIETASYGGEDNIGRITIGLREGVDHEVKSGDGSILVSLARDVLVSEPGVEGDLAAASEGDVEESPLAQDMEGDAPVSGVQTPAASEAFPAVEMVERAISESLRPATMVVSLSTENIGASTVVRITADGAVGNYNAFELEDPSRVVLDLWGVDNSIGSSRVPVDTEELAGVRIGRHPEKTRIVFDSDLPAPPNHSIEKSGDTIVVTFGETAVEAAPAADLEEPLVVASIPSDIEASTAAEPEPVAAADAEETIFEGAVAEGTAPVASVAPVEGGEQAAAPAIEAQATEPAAEPAAAPVDTGEQVAAEAPAWDETPAVEAPAAPAPPVRPEAVASVEITDVDFNKFPDRGTLTVTATGETAFTITEADEGRTLVIDIADAAIPEGLERTLDATRLSTPVRTISSYQSAVAPRKTVRVLVRLDEPTHYDAVENAGVLRVDFPLKAAEAGEVITDENIAAMTGAAGEGPAYTGRRIDLDMTEANISDVLRLMAEVSNLNIIASDDVTGTISLRLKGVPWDQAFDLILKAKGLDKVQEGNVIRVAPAEKVRQERESAIAAVRADEKLEELKLEFIPVNYASAQDLVEHVTNVLTERGSVTSEPRTNTLIVKDITKGIEAARNLISKLDTVIPQVLIEARIIEATSSFARDLGVQWGLEFESSGNVMTNTFGALPDTTFPGTPQNSGSITVPSAFGASSGTENFAVNLPATGTAGALGGLGFIFGKLGNNPLLLDLRLTAGEQEGRLKTISRPKVTTLDNKEAKIEQGESIPFETTSASGTATTFIDANLSLTVTPHITPDGSVLMKIKASRNSIGTFRTASGEPSINKKEASTEVLVRDGETTVIGGIVVSDTNNTDKGIPFFKDIPLLGWIFKNKSTSDTQTELLIFLTPTIIKERVAGAS